MNPILWPVIVVHMIAAWMLAYCFTRQFTPELSTLLENWLESQMQGRRWSTRFFICYVGLGLSSIMTWYGVNALPMASDFIFFHIHLALSFVLLTMMFSALSGCLMVFFGIVETADFVVKIFRNLRN